jgi:hypothetical protein
MTSTSQAQQEKQSRFQQYSKRMYSITLTDIPSEEYYSEYHGHKIQHLKEIVPQLKPCPVLYMAGDSSMDNKHWIDKKTKGQRPFPDPMVMDLHYHLMNELETQDLPFVPFNCAVEASTVVQHVQKEWPQDDIIRNNITSNDVLLVSIGGNDIALAPTLKTIYNMLKLIYFNSSKKLKYDTTNCFGFKYFVSLFRDQVKKYVESLISIRKPKIVMICMI